MSRLVSNTNFASAEQRLKTCSELTKNGQCLAQMLPQHVVVPFNYKRPVREKPAGAAEPAEFCGQLAPHQVEIVDKARQAISSRQSCLLTIYCGGGKTVILLHLLSWINLPTLVLVPKRALVQQWRERIATFCPRLDIRVETGRAVAFHKHVKVLVLDEVHQMFAPQNCHSLMRYRPQILLGATATPWRPNEESVFDLFFAPEVAISLSRPKMSAQVRVIWTRLQPPVEQNAGRLDWNAILNWQATDPARIQIILDQCKTAPTPQLVLVKRLDAARLLTFDPAHTQIICGSTKNTTILPSTRHVIATFSKLGTGFDFAGFNSLILTTDVCEYFEQYAGRILRSLSATPVFVDIVDDFFVLYKHFKKRREFYKTLRAKYTFVDLWPGDLAAK